MKHRVQTIAFILSLLFLLTGCSESIRHAGYNTLLGMGMAFLVLIIIALVIRVLPAITGAIEGRGDSKDKLAKKAIDQTVGQIAQKEEQEVKASVKDGEIAAVIAAAVAAYEADTGVSQTLTGMPALGAPRGQTPVVQAPPGYQGYYVRSVRRVANSKWKRN